MAHIESNEFELQRKIERWRDLMLEARRLEEEIKVKVLKLGKTVKVSGARATFTVLPYRVSLTSP